MLQNKFISDLGYKLAVSAFVSSPVALYVLSHFGEIDTPYIDRALFFIISSLITTPLRIYERIRYSIVTRNTSLSAPPIFVLGHWRSGTTYLHNLISQDENLGYVSTFQAIAPDFFLMGCQTILPVLIELIPPSNRPEDNVTVTLDGPQEEEIAIAKMMPYSFLLHLIFPRNSNDLFQKYGLMRNIPEAAIDQWAGKYTQMLRKATWRMGNKRLVLKNPINTARVKALLHLFPGAKFIHVHRNPYSVYLSTLHYYRTLLPLIQLQKISQNELEANIFIFYKRIMQQFLREKHFIPPGNFAEIRFEDLEANPLAELHDVYTSLSLPGFSDAEEAFSSYIISQANYKKNKFTLSNDVIKKVNHHWRFAFNEWGYDLIDPQKVC